MLAALVASIFSDAAHAFTELTDWLADFSANWWFLLIIFAVAFLDSVIPIVPGETMVIIGGVAAGQGEQSLLLVIAAGASGAFLGDNTAYMIGSGLSGFIERRAAKRAKSQARLDWAAQQIRLRGGMLLITARFIPGGRSVLTVSSGITHQPRAWFMGWIALAAIIWATYAAGLGYFGGKAFEDDHTKAFLVAFSAAIGMTILVEVVRHVRARNKLDIDVEVGS
ncbi:MAG TPA: DedA family protein [Ilumatobacter sp.]|jgi:membrane protein DedA with SNARE-associated domain|nr:DedA family protein [Ilumatobacter sp.]